MNLRKGWIALGLSCIWLLAACSVSPTLEPTTVESTQAVPTPTLLENSVQEGPSTNFESANPPMLDGTSWEVVDFGQDHPLAEDLPKPTMKFEGEKVSGTTGCNQYGGKLVSKADQYQFSEVSMTLMMCTQTGAMEQEQAFLERLNSANQIRLVDGILTVSGPDGEMNFTSAN